jgi:hypothetical protein
MADAVVTLPDDATNTGKKVDNSPLSVAGQEVLRQRVVFAHPTVADRFAQPTATGAIPVEGPVTDAQLRAVAVPSADQLQTLSCVQRRCR